MTAARKQTPRCDSEVIDEERAVTPVIGIVLLIAVAVILASIVGVFVLGVSDETEKPAPQASLSISADPGDDKIGLEHQAGEEVYSDRTRIVWDINDSTYRSSPPDDGAGMRSSQSTVFVFDGSSNSTGAWTNYTSPGTHDIKESHVITVTLYDTESGKRVFTDTVPAKAVREDL